MSGNVLEWVNDWYGSDYYKNSPKDNPKGPSIERTTFSAAAVGAILRVVLVPFIADGFYPIERFFNLGSVRQDRRSFHFDFYSKVKLRKKGGNMMDEIRLLKEIGLNEHLTIAGYILLGNYKRFGTVLHRF